MRIQLVRHATLIVEYGGHRFLVDPMLDDAGAREAIENSPNPRRNPLVGLPVAAQDVVKGVDAVLVTHTHSDHWDKTASEILSKSVPLFGQPADEAKFRGQGFMEVRPIQDSARFGDVEIVRTGGQHGTGKMAEMLAPVSGFVLRAQGEPTLYIAGDTVWCEDVRKALRECDPQVIVLNAGAAQFLEGGTITMSADDVVTVCREAPKARIVAVHMEAINHCLLMREDLAFQVEAARVAGQVAIPGDGEWVALLK